MTKSVGIRFAAVFLLLAMVLPEVGGTAFAAGGVHKVRAAHATSAKRAHMKARFAAKLRAALKAGKSKAQVSKAIKARLGAMVKAHKLSAAKAKALYARIIKRLSGKAHKAHGKKAHGKRARLHAHRHAA